MASPQTWLEVLSWVKALFDVSTLSAEAYSAYRRRRNEPDTRRAAELASVRYSTFSDRELEAIASRLEACRDRFVVEGSGTQRNKCFCNVFKDLIDGNGGVLPDVDDWRRICSQMCPGLI
jgi:hypothetical protein